VKDDGVKSKFTTVSPLCTFSSHGRRQCGWNRWVQGISVMFSPPLNSTRHTVHFRPRASSITQSRTL